ncbi:MAG: ABC transporter ATP-binding protein [Blastocatellia bacterium]|nr:ABC transporter ATP-binding protein [Blastocatellia bacterium]MCS7157708.1 ABC transporter ATP-binding protein [Blastocatellia bacterium]MCX7751973.1 ABC transporter ATP-binding protein [Blastocatellia bacterium]MDW8167079.1 ABC transporter ATP-binding protein [Acidobacteriota bacterium]MDW8257183.1 ABC transporter ATP-binding protein [Acidobacteriota bacterium]
MSAVIIAENLTKEYVSGWLGRRRHRAVDHVTLEVREGEIFGLLGPNGAGKTTTIKLLLQLIRPTEGTVRLFGRPPGDPAVRAQLGFLPEHPYLPEALTARELLDYFGRLFGLSRSERSARATVVLHQVGIPTSVADRPLRHLSRGELARVGFAQALLHDPKLLILDDPFGGLDLEGRRQVRDLLIRWREEGKTIFLSTPLITEAEIICDRVALLHRGRLLASGSPTELVPPTERGTMEILARDLAPQTCESLRALGCDLHADRTLVRICAPASADAWEVVDFIRRSGGRVITVNPLRSPLERFFEDAVTASEATPM